MISVIIPAYNAEEFIEETLKSVFEQTLMPNEIIVVDDGSSDKTKEKVEKFDVKYLYQSNQGVAAALNYGIRESQGEFLAFLDHDDRWLPDKLQFQVDEIQQHPEIDIVFTLIENIITNDHLKDRIEAVSEPVNGIHKSTMLVKKNAFLKVGYLSSNSRSQEFLDWFAMAIDKGLVFRTIQKTLVQRTIHGSNQTLLNTSIKSDFPKVLKAVLDRRRNNK